VGSETTAADPNVRPDLVFKTSDGYITAGTIISLACRYWPIFFCELAEARVGRAARPCLIGRVKHTASDPSSHFAFSDDRASAAARPLP
jgi:hypothetical protein